jgi:TPR repeat protein
MVESCLEKQEAPETAGRQEDADALFVLGTRYSTGRDVEHDLVAAHKWFNLAAMKGHQEARRSRADLASEMSSEQIAEAQRQARAWLAKREAKAAPGADIAANVVVRPIYVRRRAQAMRSAMSFSRVPA